jgi:ribosomal protein S18 acetylase RimI-like enzyme
MLIRRAIIKDAEKIARNNVLLAKESENTKIDYEKTLEGVKSLIDDETKGFYLVAEENGEIIGQVMITYEWSDWRARQIWWLQSIYVGKNWRRKGIMKAMINEIHQMAANKGVVVLRLYVHEKNVAAIKAYENIGMKKAPYVIYEMIL